MRTTLIAILFLAAAGLSFLNAAEKNIPAVQTDSVAASVNGDPISVREILAETARQEAILRTTLPKHELYNAILKLRKEALNKAINRKLLLDAYKQQSFKIPTQYIESALDEIALSQAIRSRREFYAKLREQNTTPEELRRLVSEQLIIQAMTARRIQLKGQVTPREIREYFDTHKQELDTQEEWELAMIAISADSPARKDPGLTELANILKSDPARFASFAEKYSPAAAGNGGSLGWIPLRSMRPDFAEACQDAKPGDVVGPIRIDHVDYFLKVLRVKPARYADFNQMEPELRKKLEAERTQKIMAEYYDELRKNAVIRIYQ